MTNSPNPTPRAGLTQEQKMIMLLDDVKHELKRLNENLEREREQRELMRR